MCISSRLANQMFRQVCESKKNKYYKCIPKLQASRFQRIQTPKKPFRRRRFRQFKFGRKKQQPGKKSTTCFLYGKPGHFAKQCPKADKKSVKIMQQIACASGYNEDDDLESVFSLDDEQGSHILFMVPAFEVSDSDFSISSSDDEKYLD